MVTRVLVRVVGTGFVLCPGQFNVSIDAGDTGVYPGPGSMGLVTDVISTSQDAVSFGLNMVANAMAGQIVNVITTFIKTLNSNGIVLTPPQVADYTALIQSISDTTVTIRNTTDSLSKQVFNFSADVQPYADMINDIIDQTNKSLSDSQALIDQLTQLNEERTGLIAKFASDIDALQKALNASQVGLDMLNRIRDRNKGYNPSGSGDGSDFFDIIGDVLEGIGKAVVAVVGAGADVVKTVENAIGGLLKSPFTAFGDLISSIIGWVVMAAVAVGLIWGGWKLFQWYSNRKSKVPTASGSGPSVDEFNSLRSSHLLLQARLDALEARTTPLHAPPSSYPLAPPPSYSTGSGVGKSRLHPFSIVSGSGYAAVPTADPY
jgi:hypothetical protein